MPRSKMGYFRNHNSRLVASKEMTNSNAQLSDLMSPSQPASVANLSELTEDVGGGRSY